MQWYGSRIVNNVVYIGCLKPLCTTTQELHSKLIFGRDYIIPKSFDPRLISTIPVAVAKAAVESGVAKQPIINWEKYEETLYARMGNDNKILRMLFNRAKTNPKKIVFAEADHLDVLKAAQIVLE